MELDEADTNGASRTWQLTAARLAVGAAFLVIVGAVGLLLIGAFHDGYGGHGAAASEWWAIRGTMGDFFGGHLASASGLAGFLLMFAAFVLQQQELQLQRLEYVRGVQESKSQTEALREQNKQLQRQVDGDQQQRHLDYLLRLIEQATHWDTEGDRERAKTYLRIAGTWLARSIDRQSEHGQQLHALFADLRSKMSQPVREDFRFPDTPRKTGA